MGNPLEKLPARAASGLVNIIIDTPKGSRNKFKYDEQAQCFRLSRILLAVPVTPANPAEYAHIKGLPPTLIGELEHFFVSYNRAHGRQYKPIARGGPAEANQALAEAEHRYQLKHGDDNGG
jgi:inorganic pyrophosphatase